jgi:hypothetical protein
MSWKTDTNYNIKKKSRLKIERMLKCGRGNTCFNDIFCVFVEIKNGPTLGVFWQFLCFAIPFCVCVCVLGTMAQVLLKKLNDVQRKLKVCL